jgi:hypothetical protein
MRAYADLYARLCAHCKEDKGCWTWTGPTRRHFGGNRPAISMRKPSVKHPVTGMAANPSQKNAARLMCELFHGPAPTPLHEASHLCEDNWLCVHPFHVIWETKKKNMARMWERRRRKYEWCPVLSVHVDMTDCPF